MQGEQTVLVRVQVIDLNAFTLDLVVPTYLPARDLTQRVARDAGLEAYWGDGKRRLYWLRARGRLIQDEETLQELGIVPGELVYLLPEPPAGSGVVEQSPDYPVTHDYTGKGMLALLGAALGVVVWALGWALAMSLARTAWTVLPPGLALGLLCTSLARHGWGGQGSAPRVAFTAMVLLLMVLGVMFSALSVLTDVAVTALYRESVGGLVSGLAGITLGWLAWWGPVEPLPTRAAPVAAGVAAVAVVPCGICRTDVTQDVRLECPYGCGQHFHSGCHKARVAVYRGDQKKCAICNAQVR